MTDIESDSRPIVAGVDHSDSAREAAEWAADIAAAWGASLHLLHIVPDVPDKPATAVPAWLVELRHAAERAGADPSVTEILSGDIVDQIVDRSRNARMLVLGSYGEGARSGMLAGTVALALLARVNCPVAIVRSTTPHVPPPRGGPVVVGIDGSPAGRTALTTAAELAASLGARLVAVHAWTDVSFEVDGTTHRRTEDDSVLGASASAMLDRELAAVVRTRPGLPLDRVVVNDTPLRALLARAAGARLIVVGRRSIATGSSMVLGSTSQALAAFVSCPVVVTGPEVATGQAPRATATSATTR